MYDHKVTLKTNGDVIDVFEKIDSIIDAIPEPKLQQHLKDISELLKLPFVLRMDGGDLSHLGNNELKEYVQRYDAVRTWLRKKRNREQLKAALSAVEKSTNKKAVAKCDPVIANQSSDWCGALSEAKKCSWGAISSILYRRFPRRGFAPPRNDTLDGAVQQNDKL